MYTASVTTQRDQKEFVEEGKESWIRTMAQSETNSSGNRPVLNDYDTESLQVSPRPLVLETVNLNM